MLGVRVSYSALCRAISLTPKSNPPTAPSIAEKIERDSRCECCAGYRELDVGYMQHLWGDCFQAAQKKEKRGKGMEALVDYLKCLEVSYQLDQMIQDVEGASYAVPVACLQPYRISPPIHRHSLSLSFSSFLNVSLHSRG